MASGERRGSPTRALLGCVLAQVALPGAARAEEEPPDVELLAYLGSWAGTDEEWVAVAEWDGKPDDAAPAEPEPAPSEEKDDD